MLDILLIVTLINETYAYVSDPYNEGEIVFDIILVICSMITFPLLATFYRPVRAILQNIWKWVDMYRLNPNLDLEISISGEIPPIGQSDFVQRINESINNVSSYTNIARSNEHFEFAKRFKSFNSNITISPGYNSQSNKYDFIYIRVKTNNLKLKNIIEGLGEVQLFLFRDVVSAITQKLRFNVNKDNEEISINLKYLPILKLPGDLHTENIVANGEGIRVTFSYDNITINGSIDRSTLVIIEDIIRSNLVN